MTLSQALGEMWQHILRDISNLQLFDFGVMLYFGGQVALLIYLLRRCK